MYFKLLFLFFISFPLFSFDNFTLNKIKISYEVGKNIVTKDGTTFQYILPAIFGQESNWGKAIIGDKYYKNGKLKSLYKTSLGNFQIKLSTAKEVILKTPSLYKKYNNLLYKGPNVYSQYQKILKNITYLESKLSKNIILKSKYFSKIKYFSSILSSKSWNKRAKNGNKKALITLQWAKNRLSFFQNKELLEKTKQRKYNQERDTILIKKIFLLKNKLSILSYKAHKDTLLINKLLLNIKFSATIAGNYLRLIYNDALKKHLKKPLIRTIGRYNGGWNNTVYYNNINHKLSIVHKLLKQ